MKENSKSLLTGLAVIIAAVGIVALVGLFAIHPQKELITGEADATEYRVSNIVPGHVDTVYVKEGDHVKKGDTLAHIASKQVAAKMQQATAVKSAASAQSRKAKVGARDQQKQMAYQVWQKAKAAVEVYRKSYERVKGLYEKGVVSAQKFDEVEAQYKVAQADCAAAEQQYLMAEEGARREDIDAAARCGSGPLEPGRRRCGRGAKLPRRQLHHRPERRSGGGAFREDGRPYRYRQPRDVDSRHERLLVLLRRA